MLNFNYIYYIYNTAHLTLSSLYYLTKLVSRTATINTSLLGALLRLLSNYLLVSTYK